MMRAWMLAGMSAVGVASAQAQSGDLAQVLAQLNAASARFHSAQASFSWDQYTAVVQEHDVQTGTIAFRRDGGSIAMVVHVAAENGQPAPKDVLYKGGVLDLYQPGIHQETVLQAGAKRGTFESYATLGFGGSGTELAAQWNVAYEGMDMVDGTKVDKLNLTPKQPAADQMFTHIEIWIDPATATSRKQIFYTASGDSRTALYTDVKLNSVAANAFALKVPHGTQVIQK